MVVSHFILGHALLAEFDFCIVDIRKLKKIDVISYSPLNYWFRNQANSMVMVIPNAINKLASTVLLC